MKSAMPTTRINFKIVEAKGCIDAPAVIHHSKITSKAIIKALKANLKTAMVGNDVYIINNICFDYKQKQLRTPALAIKTNNWLLMSTDQDHLLNPGYYQKLTRLKTISGLKRIDYDVNSRWLRFYQLNHQHLLIQLETDLLNLNGEQISDLGHLLAKTKQIWIEIAKTNRFVKKVIKVAKRANGRFYGLINFNQANGNWQSRYQIITNKATSPNQSGELLTLISEPKYYEQLMNLFLKTNLLNLNNWLKEF